MGGAVHEDRYRLPLSTNLDAAAAADRDGIDRRWLAAAA
jgi:hypothetical protein